MSLKKLVDIMTAVVMLLSFSFCMAEESEHLVLAGTGEMLGMDGVTMQPTGAALAIDLDEMAAAIELTTETMGMNFYLLASGASANPEMAILYIMCSVCGIGEVTETEEGYLVSFAWEAVSMDEATGATVTTPMTLEIAVTVSDGVYTATLDYLGVVVELSSDIAEE